MLCLGKDDASNKLFKGSATKYCREEISCSRHLLERWAKTVTAQ